MPSSTSPRASFDTPGQIAARWIGVLAGPILWSALLEVNYTLSYVACEQGSKWMLHLAAAVAIGLVLLAGVGTWRVAPPFGDESLPSTAPNPERTALVRARFMTYGGLALCAWFTLVMLAMEVPAALLQPCNP